MYGGTTGRHVARHGADPARPGGAPVDPTLGHDMFQRPRPVRVHGGPERPRSARASVRASGSSFMPTCHVLPGARNHHRDAPRGDGHLARETVRPDGAMRFAPRLSSGYHLSAWSNSVYRSRCSDTPRRRSGKSQPRRERAGGSRKAADMHCTMMSDHDLPVVVSPFD